MDVAQGILASLHAEIAQLEVEIQAKEEKGKQAIPANMPDRYIDCLQKDFNHLMEEQNDWRRQLFPVQLRIVTPVARKSSMTGRESHPSSAMPVSDT